MNSIMVDNWLMQDIVYNSYESENKMSNSYIKMLSAIVLWEDIYYPLNDMSLQWSQNATDTIASIASPISDFDYIFEDEAYAIYEELFRDNETHTVAQGAIRYLLLSNYKNLDYLPSATRSDFLNKCNFDLIIDRMSRFDYMKVLDTFIEEHFKEFNRALGRDCFKIERPVLTDFIIQNTPQGMSHIDFALHLKNEGPVVKYRKYLSDIENAIEKREWLVLKDMIESSKDIVAETVNLDKRSIITGELTLLPTPSFSISKELTINKRRTHLTFLEDLTKFAFNGRKF